MSQPTPYEPSYSFTDFASGSPSSQPPGVKLDAEFSAIATTTAGTIDNLALIQRDDGALRNDSVGVDQLSDAALSLIAAGGFDVRGPWVTLTSYAVGDVVSSNSVIYLSLAAHTAGVLATDVAAGKFVAIFDSANVVLQSALALSTGLGMIGSTGGITAQAALNAKVSLTALAAAGGAQMIGTAAGPTVEAAMALLMPIALLAASGGAANVGSLLPATGARSRTVEQRLSDGWVSLNEFLTAGRAPGATNDSPAFQAAWNYSIATGATIWVPAGQYRLNDQIAMKSSLFGTLVSGLTVYAAGGRFQGAGAGLVTIQSAVSNAAALAIESDCNHATTAKFLLGVELNDMTLTKAPGVGAVNTSGINIWAAYHLTMNRVAVMGFDNDGVKVQCDNGDTDGSAYLSFYRCLFHNNGRWGLDAMAAAGHNEISFMLFDHCWWQNNGTAAAFQVTPTEANSPTSGGLRWKGQGLVIRGGGFTVNQNVGLFIPAHAAGGLAANASLEGVAWENGILRHVLVQGCVVLQFKTIQLYSNDAFIARVAMEFYPVQPIYAVTVDGVLVRATSGNNNYVAFKNTKSFSQEPGHVSVKGVAWQAFYGTGGQSRFVGIEFDRVPDTCALSFSGSTITLAPTDRGNTVPLRLRTPSIGTASEDGEYVSYNVPTAGLAVAATLTTNGTFAIYLADIGNLPTLEQSATGPVRDGTSGPLVKTGETGKTYRGRCSIVGGALVTGVAARWCNPTFIPGAGWQWANASDKLMFKASTSGDYSTLPTSDADGVAQA